MKGTDDLPRRCDVAIVGGGPAGLGAAIELARLGAGDVRVLEREDDAGGIPRHCGHPPFGARDYRRIYTGPRYAATLLAEAAKLGVRIHTRTTVVSVGPGPRLTLSTPDGARELEARRVLLATGVRETPRAARLASGARPLGVVTTGALQSMIYLSRLRPFTRPVIVGTELVSFSALLTCRHAGIRPVAMIEAGQRPVAWRMSTALPRMLGIDVRLDTRIARVLGRARVEGVEIVSGAGAVSTVDCDGVVFSGMFVPESALARLGHLEIDPGTGGPRVDEFGRASDPHYFVAGNLLRPVETAGWCREEGRAAARCIRDSLDGALPDPARQVAVVPDHPLIRYVMPQRLTLRAPAHGMRTLQLRVAGPARGRLSCVAGERVVAERTVNSLPERRILLRLGPGAAADGDAPIRVRFNSS